MIDLTVILHVALAMQPALNGSLVPNELICSSGEELLRTAGFRAGVLGISDSYLQLGLAQTILNTELIASLLSSVLQAFTASYYDSQAG